MRGISIRFRLLVVIVLITVIPVASITWIATKNTRNSVEQEVISANNSRMDWASQYLTELTEQLRSLFYTLQIDQGLIASLADLGEADEEAQTSAHRYLKDTLNSVFYAYSHRVDQLTLYNHQNRTGFSVSFQDSGRVFPLDVSGGSWERLSQEPVGLYFTLSPDGVYAFHSINRFQDQALIGGFSVRIRRRVWQELASILITEPESSLAVLNDQGEVLFAQTNGVMDSFLENLSLEERTQAGHYRTGDFYYWLRPVTDSRLVIVKKLPVEVVQESAIPTIKAGWLTGIVVAVLAVVLSIMVSFRFSRPIIQLARRIRSTDVDEIRVRLEDRTDEIGTLEQAYDAIISQIKILLQEEYQREIDLKDAQFKALQAQINPHFLNNTLNLIGGMALAKEAPEIYRVTQMIGDLLHYAVSQNESVATLKEELANLRNYTSIQQMRFANRCQVEVQVEPDLEDCLIPRFTLQPLVENAFEHGLQSKTGPWNVQVLVKKTGMNRLFISVFDNGIGMDPDELRRIRRRLHEKDDGLGEPQAPAKKKGIGLRNVDSRLKMHFGFRSGLRIFSTKNSGTLVSFSIPIQKEGSDSSVSSSLSG
jgi:two-component system sensor histidine kinase YesM